MKNKKCTSCNTVKPVTEFHKNSGCKYNVDSKCKVCKLEYYNTNKEKYKEKYFKKTYNLSLEEYKRLGTTCKICGGTSNMVVDHNHHTGEVRGLLCSQCNSGLGFFKDSSTNLLEAVKYLDLEGSYESAVFL